MYMGGNMPARTARYQPRHIYLPRVFDLINRPLIAGIVRSRPGVIQLRHLCVGIGEYLGEYPGEYLGEYLGEYISHRCVGVGLARAKRRAS